MSRSIGISGKGALTGEVNLPGDKSISHRVAMLAGVAQGTSRVHNFASSVDCHSTLDCVRRLGLEVEVAGGEVVIHGKGLRGTTAASPVALDAGNSGSTIRMISGILAGQSFASVIDGDASLRRRPMRRIIEPLTAMGARITARDDNFAPLEITGGELRAIDYVSRVASAQIKTCVLFAGLYAAGRTTFREPSLSRNHSELMLAEFGARFQQEDDGRLIIDGGAELGAVDYRVPGDVSSAAFFVAGASALAGSRVTLAGVSLNPTRTGFLDVLKHLGASVETQNVRSEHHEPVGDLCASGGQLKTGADGLLLDGDIIPNIIDEIPILAVLATQVEGRVEVRGARELRVKESDRIKTVVAGIRAMGGTIDEFEDGFAVAGPQALRGARIESEGDHRIAMAFAMAGLMAAGRTEIVDADCAAVSFPEFYDALAALTGEGRVFRPDET